MKNKRIISLILVMTLITSTGQQVHAENVSNPKEMQNEKTSVNLQEKENERENLSDNESESGETSNDSQEAIGMGEKSNNEEDDSSKEDEEIEEENQLTGQTEENIEESIAIQSIEPETSSEPEKPDNLTIGGYIESELDYNTPVYCSDADTYSDIPSSFPDDMDTFNSTYPEARNQNPYGTCWAFSSMGLGEFDLINDSLNGNGEFDSNTDLSELQLAYFTYNSVVDPLGGTEGDSAKYYNENATESYLNYGGNYEMASRRLAQWYGPVNESLVPYAKAADTISNGLNDSYAFGHDEAHLENAYLINIKENADEVKQQIMEHGAAGIMYYHNDSSFGWNNTLGKYAYHDIDKSGGGHAVMIVGWDDDFSKDNFTGASKPSNDGAWLVRNSWGYYASYFWMSYESASLADTAWIFDFSAEDDYDNNYQLDGGVQSYPDKEHKILANVFKTKQEEGTTAEILSAVSLSFTEAANVQYTVDIYTDLQDETDPYSGTKQENATTTGETAYAGIYTIPLENSVTLKPGTTFAVVVSVNSAVLDYEQATSIATGEGLTTMVWDCRVSKGNNKSFYFSGGKFYSFYWGNYCVKAFTTDSDIEEPEKPQEKLEGLQEKDGALYYFKNGEIDTTYTGTSSYQGEIYYCENGQVVYEYTGFVETADGEYLYIENGKQVTEYTGLAVSDSQKNIWWYVQNGVYNKEYTGLVEYKSILWYVRDGVLIWSYNGVCDKDETWWSIKGGRADKVYTGFVETADGEYLYIENGKQVTEYTGLAVSDSQKNIWWYVQNGVYNKEYTGLVEYKSILWYVRDGVLIWSYNGVCDKDETWWSIKGGRADKVYTGFVEAADGEYLYIENGKQATEYTGLAVSDSQKNIWWYVQNGVYNKEYTGLVEYKSILWYVRDGVLIWSYNGVCDKDETWWSIKGGRADKVYTGFVEAADGEYLYIENGKQATEYTGLAVSDSQKNIWWYVQNGVYNKEYTGLVEYKSILWYIRDGVLIWSYNGVCDKDETWWSIKGGRADKVYTGFVEAADGEYLYIENGKQVTEYTGLAVSDSQKNIWWYVQNGVYNKEYTGLVEYKSILWYVRDGVLIWSYNGVCDKDETWWSIKGGRADKVYTGFVEAADGEYLYIENGKQATEYTGLAVSDSQKNIWWYVQNGVYNKEYTGLVEYKSILWYVRDGVLIWSYNGVCDKDETWWSIKGGRADKVYTGFVEAADGEYLYIENGKQATEYTGLAVSDSQKNIWWYVQNGVYNKEYTGLVEYKSILWYVRDGVLIWSYNGVCDKDETWWSIKGGRADKVYTGFVEAADGEYLYIENGKQATEYTGLAVSDSQKNIWWYVQNGVYNKEYTGLVEYKSILWYVRDGVLIWSYNGVCDKDETWWSIKGGRADKVYTGFVEAADGEYLYIENGKQATEYTGLAVSDSQKNIWWYVQNGVYNKEYTGLVEYKSILWYVRDGVLDWNYTGTIYFEDKEYTIVNGRVAYKKCRINKCEIDTVERTDKSIKKLTIALHTILDGVIESFKERYYIVLLDSRGQNILSSAPVTESSTDGDLSFSATFISSDGFKMEATGKYALAVKSGDSFEILSNALYISNPEAMARQDGDFKDKYWGYYEGYKVYSKKGIQGADKAYTADLGVQHVLLNVDIQDLVSAGPQSGYIPYTYKGTTFYFSDLIALKKDIYDLHGWGSDDGNNYGENISRNVTLVLLMSWKHDELSYLIHPAARIKGAAPYYSLNMQDEYARNTFEALFCYMGDEFGQMKTRVNNWTLGNELNSCNAWNYAGSMSLNDYVSNYAQAFQMLHQAVRRTAASPRLFISLDHCWNTADAGFTGKAFLDTFASYMNQTAPDMEWNVNYHSYSQPLSNNAFWNAWWNTTDDISTRYISMRNISVLTNYLSYLEQIYGKKSGSIRVIIGELGYSATKGGAESQQAAALGYGYYIAMANKRIDSYIIRAYVDDPTETAAGLYLGLNADWGYHVKKEAYEVYKYLDRNQSFDYMNRYLGLIGIGSWESAIAGFNASEITAGERMFQ